MTERYFNSLINKLNRKNTGGLIFLRPLSDKIDYGKVWAKNRIGIKKVDNYSGPYKHYFIKNEEGFYVATVLDMGSNLHWYVLPKFRKQGYLTRALSETILYHIFQDRDEQRITIDEIAIGQMKFEASRAVAISLGFTKTKETNGYLLKKEQYLLENYLYGEDTYIDKEREDYLVQRIENISRLLWIVQTEIEMKIGNSEYTDELMELVLETRAHKYKFQSILRGDDY
jgi:hypothetical protein